MMQVEVLQSPDFDASYAVFSQISTTNWSASVFMQSAAQGHSLLVKSDAKIIAYCMCSKVLDELSIEDIAVCDEWLRKGVAKTMLNRLIDMARDEFINGIFLEVRRSNKAARALYRSMGFELVGERKNYYPAFKGAEKEDALVLKYFVH